MWPIDRPPQWVGRSQELAALRDGVEALRRDEGAVIWVEGEPGIGKSSLVAEALAEAGDPEWDIGWGIADQLTEKLPLRVMLDCLQVRPDSPDPRRARAAGLLGSQRPGLFADGDAAVAGPVIGARPAAGRAPVGGRSSQPPIIYETAHHYAGLQCPLFGRSERWLAIGPRAWRRADRVSLRVRPEE
jgi:hypothetical protein